jgi:hypothetical protein
MEMLRRIAPPRTMNGDILSKEKTQELAEDDSLVLEM